MCSLADLRYTSGIRFCVTVIFYLWRITQEKLANHFNENGFLFRSLPGVAQNCVWYPFYLYKSSIYPKSACLSPSPALGPIAHSQKMKNGAIYVVRWTKSENTDASWIWLAKGQSHYSSQKKYNCRCNLWFKSWRYF